MKNYILHEENTEESDVRIVKGGLISKRTVDVSRKNFLSYPFCVHHSSPPTSRPSRVGAFSTPLPGRTSRRFRGPGASSSVPGRVSRVTVGAEVTLSRRKSLFSGLFYGVKRVDSLSLFLLISSVTGSRVDRSFSQQWKKTQPGTETRPSRASGVFPLQDPRLERGSTRFPSFCRTIDSPAPPAAPDACTDSRL